MSEAWRQKHLRAEKVAQSGHETKPFDALPSAETDVQQEVINIVKGEGFDQNSWVFPAEACDLMALAYLAGQRSVRGRTGESE